LLRIAQQQYPADYRINDALAYSCLRRVTPARIDDAVRFSTCALALRPQSAHAHFFLAEALTAKNAHGEAVVAFSNAIALKPDFIHAYTGRANSYRVLGQSEKALADFAKGIAINPQMSDGWIARADALAIMGQDELACADYSAAFARSLGPANKLWQKYLEQRDKIARKLAKEQPAEVRGQTVVLGYNHWASNGNRQGKMQDGADLRWESNLKLKMLHAVNGAKIGIVVGKPFDKLTLEDLKKFNFRDEKVARAGLNPGAVLAVRTADGNLAKLRIVGYRAKHDFGFEEAGSLTPYLAAFYIRSPNVNEMHLEIEWVIYRD